MEGTVLDLKKFNIHSAVKSFRTDFFKNLKHMRKTYTFFKSKISSIGKYAGFCTVV